MGTIKQEMGKMKLAVPVALLAILSGCAVNSGIVATSDDTYYVSRQAATGFTGLSGLRPEAIKEANEQCAKMGKKYIEIGSKESQPPYILGNFPRVEIQFRCVKTGPKESEQCFKNLASDPELAGLKDKVALGSVKDQTFTMLADNSKPTAKEKDLLKIWGSKRDTCIRLDREELQADKAPLPISNLNNSYLSAGQLLVADLMNGNLTYSSYAVKRQELAAFVNDTASKIQAELRKETQDSRYKAEQLAIEAQRNSLMQQKIYSDRDMQQQQIQSDQRINQQRIQAESMRSLTKPSTTTDCQVNGPGIRCTTQ